MRGIKSMIFAKPDGSYTSKGLANRRQFEALVAFEVFRSHRAFDAFVWLATMTEHDLQKLVTASVRRKQGKLAYDFNSGRVDSCSADDEDAAATSTTAPSMHVSLLSSTHANRRDTDRQ